MTNTAPIEFLVLSPDGVQSGPFTRQQMRDLYAQGAISSGHRLRKTVDERWYLAKNVTGLFEGVEQRPPEPTTDKIVLDIRMGTPVPRKSDWVDEERRIGASTDKPAPLSGSADPLQAGMPMPTKAEPVEVTFTQFDPQPSAETQASDAPVRMKPRDILAAIVLVGLLFWLSLGLRGCISRVVRFVTDPVVDAVFPDQSSDSPAATFAQSYVNALQGDAVAQFNLGVYYENGEGVARDAAEAVRWYRKAAEQDLAAAQRALDRIQRDPGRRR